MKTGNMVGFITLALLLAHAHGAPIFITDPGAPLSGDRAATFSPLVEGQTLAGYTEDGLFFNVNDAYSRGLGDTWWGGGYEGDHYYGQGGNYEFVTISTTDGSLLYELEMAVSDGWYVHRTSNELHIRWETWRDGAMTGWGNENDLIRGDRYGFVDTEGIDELRIAAYKYAGSNQFGDFNAISIDNVTARTSVPEPSTLSLLGLGIAALLGVAARRRKL